MELISVALAYCLKEPLKSGRRQGVPCADPLRSPITDYWRHARILPWGFKGSALKLMRIFNLLHYLPHHFLIRGVGWGSHTSRTQRGLRWPLKYGVPEFVEQPFEGIDFGR
ncbi:hypothetical protein TNCV_2501451 [Trichonephila clavipes]|nr:hypothetical protein TNCV_2501451 [Trichonephila clavipes]